tara:strand:- start:8263 stop:10503 length:2241 start_codon:yes stop_codon:yes gene_type:complete
MTTGKPDYAVRDWIASKPRIRDQVRFHYQDDNGTAIYVLEDLVNRSYIQIGVPEYRFLRGLDGSRTVAQLLSSSAGKQGEEGLSEDDVSSLLRWLLDQQLLEPEDGEQGERRFLHHESQSSPQRGSPLMKLLFWRISLGSPDRFFHALNRLFGWFFSLPAMLVWLGTIGYAAYLASTHWRALVDAGSRAVLPGNWLSLILVYVVLKVFHEFGHGIATKRFRGVVPEWGVQLIAFVTPLTYVDATASWAFRSRRKRLIVAFAGIYVELFLAAIALFVWSRTDPGTVQTMAANIAIAASSITLLFNANPLMRFDGYYMLSDLLGLRNLAPRGQQLMQWLGRKVFFGAKGPMPRGTRRQTGILFFYGSLAAMWRVLIFVGIMALVSQMFQGAGLLLVGIGILIGVATLLYSLIKLLIEDHATFLRAAVRMVVILGLAGCALWVVQVSPAPTALALVEFPDKAILRAEAPGFVSQVLCQDGDRVAKGDLLAILENEEEKGLLEQLELDLKRSRQQALQYLDQEQVSSYQAELDVQMGLEERLSTQRQRVASLEFRSPIAGIVREAKLDSKPGRYLRTGERFLSVYPDVAPQLLISARQDDAEALGETAPRIRCRLRGRPNEMVAVIHRIEKRATVAVPHWALAASSGGPLPVREVSQGNEKEQGLAAKASGSEALNHFRGVRPEMEGMSQELSRPRMVAYATLESVQEAMALREGEWGHAKLTHGNRERLGSWIYRKTFNYLRSRFEQRI